MANNIFHVIKDPVHGSMQFATEEDNWIKPFIDSPNFQRLRHIKQLGLTDWVFPGAVHTRFNHGLGCCYITSQISKKLGLSSKERQLVILAGLLHDIGHGPFSHAFEEIFAKQTIRHEMWTPMFLNEYANDEFFDNFNKINKDTPLNKAKLKKVQNLIMHNAHDNKLLADIVSSQLDADRLDYLLRDSHFCGVMYGEYDFRWLLHCLTPIKNNGIKRLGITHKGVGVTEQYLMARRLMMRNIYQNSKKYGAEILLKEFLKHLAAAINDSVIFENLEQSPLISFLINVANFNQTATKKTTNLEKLKTKFLKDNYPLYKQLRDYDVFSLIRNLATWKINHPVVTLAKRLQNRTIPKMLHINEKNVKRASKIVKDFKADHKNKIHNWQITMLHLPHLSYEISKDPILVEDVSGSAKYLHDNSLMISAISDQYEQSCLVAIDIELIEQTKIKKLIQKLQTLS